MSVFDLFRGFFGIPGGHYRGEGRREPFFDVMTHDDDDDDDDDDDNDDDGGFYSHRYHGDQQDPFDHSWRFGFSFGPNGMRIAEPPAFGQMFREMEEIFSQLGHWEGVPSIEAPPPQDRPARRGGGSSGNPLRDKMLKSSGDLPEGSPAGPPREPEHKDSFPSGSHPTDPSSPFPHWTPFSKFHDDRRWGSHRHLEEERRQDGDLDSIVSSGDLDQILGPSPAQSPSQPKSRSFFQSVTVTKVVKPDGSVEERRTVRDSQGNEETTVTHSGGPDTPQGTQDQKGPLIPDDLRLFNDMRDDSSLFSKFFKLK